MGVKGLSSFIDAHPVLLTDFKLHDTRVILDGNNLIHFIYQNYNDSYQYNGDYYNYYNKIVQVFTRFKQCNVKAYVIFDGGYSISDSKLPTLLDRAKRRIVQAYNNCSLLPILAKKVFQKVLDELEVDHVTCSFEADEEIAILANLWNCPVISNDSDFFVYNLKAGFLPLNYVDFCPVSCSFKSDIEFIPAQKYHFDHYHHILDHFKPEMIPLIATVVGNDFIKYDTFARFTSKFNARKYKSCSTSNVVSRIKAILLYFDQYETFEEGRAAITKNVDNTGGIASLQHVIEQSLQSYMKINTQKSLVADFFTNCCDWSELIRNDYFHQPLPLWFIQGVMNGGVSPDIQNMALLHRIFLSCQQEQITQVSSHDISLHIRQVLYGILFLNNSKENLTKKNKANVTKKNKKVLRDFQMEEIGRNGKELGRFYINPQKKLRNYGKLPRLAEIDNLPEKRRRELIITTLGVSPDFLNLFDSADHLLMSVLSYWVANSHISSIQLEALILTIIFLRIKCLCKNSQNRSQQKSFSRNKYSIDYVLTCLTKKELKALDVEPEERNGVPIENVHRYSQYQSCLLFTLLLNEILQSPFEEPVLWQVYDGLLVYHFNKCLAHRQSAVSRSYDNDVLCKIEEHPKIVKLCKNIVQAIRNDSEKKKKYTSVVYNIGTSTYVLLILGLIISITTTIIILSYIYIL